jgi:hypothetical protein
MPDDCTLCGDRVRFQKSELVLLDRTDATRRHIQGALCENCYTELIRTAEGLAQ